MHIILTDEQKMTRGFYFLAKAFIQAYPAMSPWEIVNWLNNRMGFHPRISEAQLTTLKQAWNDLGLADWDKLMSQKELANSII